jgi:hypothetical protein
MPGLIKSFTKTLGNYNPKLNQSGSLQHQFKVHSYGSLSKTIQLLDLFLMFLNQKNQILLSFTLECLEKFKPLVDQLYQQLYTL